MIAAAAPWDAAWAALAAAVVSQRRGAHLVPLSGLLGRTRSSRVLSLVLLAGWAWLGWHFFAR